ncbi:hypothetical protein Tco_0725156 [Tanacetum coccineum]|uniref:Tf2-1-like SH3-like domain-containing protein n=1 Tax=Tanacetum coccineum TaxID=301880 RepID=A0ABQ4YCY1_9ASTR
MQELSEQLQELQDKVLELLRKEKLYAKFTKSKAVKNLEVPTTPSEIGLFLGLTVERESETKRVKSMSMTESVRLLRTRILATSCEATRLRQNVGDAVLSRKGNEVKKLDVSSTMTMTIQYGVRGMILAAYSEAFKQENILAERLHGLDQQMERKEEESFYTRRLQEEKLARINIYEIVARNRVPVPVLWAEIREGSLIGPELVQEMTDKVVVIKEKLQAARDRQKSYADSGRKMTEYEVGENVLLKVSPWKGVMHFGKKGKLAPRYVGPFEILEKIGLIAYRLRLPEELIGVHDTFHVSNLKKYLGNANLHVPLNEIIIDKTLHFVKELVEIIDREVKSLKHSRIPLVKVC